VSSNVRHKEKILTFLNQVLFKMAIFIVACSACNAEQQNMYTSPDAVSVRPVFFVPEGQSAPTDSMRNLARRHIKWSQETYSKLLAGRDTFRISPEPSVICKGKYDLSCYKKLPENGVPNFLSEILDHLNMNRFNCPYVFAIIVMNEKDHFPSGGGCPFNGGLNTGGGIVLWNSFDLISCPNNQSTLRHELGHAFGLPHVDVYGYPMNSNASIPQ